MRHQPSPNRPRARMWLLACAVIVGVIAAIAVKTNVFGVTNTTERAVQDRCETDVRGKLASPQTAQLAGVQATVADLEPDSRDLFALTTDEPLKGVDQSRITVWNVSGTVEAQTEVGSTIHDPFTCRAYFVDGNLVDTLVLFDREH
ncbi:hypothetical protein [Mycolicibacterium sp. HK-90]|uniref:hypothetical protein n=1 Tax=Mycolicibacterium sp. HK-90 TaxID=3056937 RepID=UPI0026582AE2|nr:hypothetical protein [Mycolicibacterium sp. HK-90]WKG00773.1 hypothetical protein QU592_15710 [Mycolicibacterium sp. HK-90]